MHDCPDNYFGMVQAPKADSEGHHCQSLRLRGTYMKISVTPRNRQTAALPIADVSHDQFIWGNIDPLTFNPATVPSKKGWNMCIWQKTKHGFDGFQDSWSPDSPLVTWN